MPESLDTIFTPETEQPFAVIGKSGIDSDVFDEDKRINKGDPRRRQTHLRQQVIESTGCDTVFYLKTAFYGEEQTFYEEEITGKRLIDLGCSLTQADVEALLTEDFSSLICGGDKNEECSQGDIVDE